MKFLVVDDHALIREALRGVLVELQRDAVVLEAGTCGEAMALIQQHADLSLMLLDLKLPDRDRFDVMAELRDHHPALSVAMLSAFNDRDNVIKALNGGAPVSSRRPVRATCWSARCGSSWRVASISRRTS